jgi:hypothetical protein
MYRRVIPTLSIASGVCITSALSYSHGDKRTDQVRQQKILAVSQRLGVGVPCTAENRNLSFRNKTSDGLHIYSPVSLRLGTEGLPNVRCVWWQLSSIL